VYLILNQYHQLMMMKIILRMKLADIEKFPSQISYG
jgi:hypothetical protein